MSPGPAVARVEPDTAVIQGKLGIPAPARELVDRPRLDHLLAELIEHHHTVVVSATAGSGKTTAVAHALEHSDRPVAWLTVDATDRAPGRLLTYIEAALADPLPQLGGTVSGAMAAGIPHAEVAGLLAEAVGDEPIVLVLDELERLTDDSDAWPVIEALLRYAPPELHAVLISRRVMPAFLWGRGPWKSEVAVVGDADLAFNTAEAAAALRLHADTDVDAQGAIEATHGWVTGVLFEAWRATGHVAGSGGEADPLHGYLSTHMLNQLQPAERDFLVATSLLFEVTPKRAAALGQAEPAERMRALRRCHLPITWAPKGLVMRCHSRFREYLLDRLDEKDPGERRALRLAYAGLLADRGYVEEATEEFLAADALEEALEPAERAIVPIIERLDFPVAERWLKALEPVANDDGSQLAKAELMLALAQNDLRRGNAIADRLSAASRRDELVRRSATIGGLLGWCYLHAGRVEEARGLVELMEPGLGRDALRYGLGLWGFEPPIPRPELTGGPLDGLILIADYHYGRLVEIVGEGASGWMDVMAHPPRIGALRALGRTQEALELYEAARAHGVGTQRLEVSFGIEVLLDAGLLQQAGEALTRRRAHAAQAG